MSFSLRQRRTEKDLGANIRGWRKWGGSLWLGGYEKSGQWQRGGGVAVPWLRWLPWRFFIRRLARAHGFLDPVAVLARLQRFAQPSEVAEPVELLRAGVVFHARGLINARVIQHNLDWVWPFWIERQFDPRDVAFVPRAFSITHVNLTHRNWTAIGLPDVDALPVVDPRGLLTPHFDGWSLDVWLITDDGRRLLPSRAARVCQRWQLDDPLAVVTQSEAGTLRVTNEAAVVWEEGGPVCRLRIRAVSDSLGWLVVALRPSNPEGIALIHRVALDDHRQVWWIDEGAAVLFEAPVERHRVADYHTGDVAFVLDSEEERDGGICDVGMMSAAAMYRLAPHEERRLTVRAPLKSESCPEAPVSWAQSLSGACRFEVPDEHWRFLYQAALRTLVLHSPGEVYPGPYTYKRFWFRDAAFIIHALLCAGLVDRAERALDGFPARQSARGYFHSQEGEWDANGQALWIFERFCALTGRAPKAGWVTAIRRGGRWIGNKRLKDAGTVLHAGLLPAGFSAEHLGPNDFYYWDDFWGVGGLRSAAALAGRLRDESLHKEFTAEAEAFAADVDRSLRRVAERLGRPAMPASPYRRLDAGAIGSLAAGYPLQLWPPGDPRLSDTVDYLLAECRVGGGFFQDMIHAGINAYLTLHIAQVLLRAGDHRFLELLDTVAALASPTGQWPEAIHPRTGGGCMGDGHHAWAAAEWVMMMRHLFVREEAQRLVLCQGIPGRWLSHTEALRFGPAPTAFGPVTVEVHDEGPVLRVAWRGSWHGVPPQVEVCLPGTATVVATGETNAVTVEKPRS